ncbi:TRAP transporter large permease [Fodinicurvata sp. EGI_FJ10296]|uniref:TRAP transporter large permease n=1 Tax=Fodinicurvata sp. EGI_FJ10296 TaxID=3231908 RepID=UPI003455FDAD
MELLSLFAVFFVFLLAGAPVAVALGLGAIGFLVFSDSVQFSILALRLLASLDSVPLLAIPFFVLAGELMNTGGITHRIFDFARKLLGHVRGGLAHVNILASLFFAGISGSAVADAAGLGRIEIKAMREASYPAPFAAAVTAASSAVGPIIPPSIMLVLYGTMADVSIGKLFAGGLVPGLLLAVAMMIYVTVVARGLGVPVDPRTPLRGILRSLIVNLPPLLTPVLVMTALVAGVVTPTEAGVFTAIYAAGISFLYGGLTLRMIPEILENTLVVTGQILFILALSVVFGWLITTERIPELLGVYFLETGLGQYAFLALLNVVLLVLGCFMSLTSILIIVTPMLIEMTGTLGIDPVHIGVVMVLNLTIGLMTPPLGWCLYIVTEIAEIRFEETVRAVLPFLIPLIAVLILITYVPWTVTGLADFFFD